MAIGRISGALLFSDLDRQSTDLAFTTNGKPLTYMDFTNFRFGVNTNSLVDTFTVTGTANISGVAKIFGNLVASSGTAASSVATGALVVAGGAGISGNVYANGNIILATGSQSNVIIGDGSTSSNVVITGTRGSTSTTTGALVVRGGVGIAGAITVGSYISTASFIGISSNLQATSIGGTSALYTSGGVTIRSGNLYISGSAGNAIVAQGSIVPSANLAGNIGSTTNYWNNIFVSTIAAQTFVAANITATTAYAANFSTGNAVILGGYFTNISNASINTGNVSSWYSANLNSTSANLTTASVQNFSTGNVVVSGGYISGLANISATGAMFNNLSSGNVLISGGYISSLSNATITTANIASINFSGVTVSSIAGNLVLSPLTSNGNNVVTISATSALQLPAGTTAQQPTSVYGGAIRWNNSTNTLEVYTGSSWVSLLGQINNQIITPDGVSTVFALDYSTTAEGIIVSINGTLQQPGAAYTVAGSQITFTEIPLITDVISIRYIAAGTVTAENTQEVNSANVALTTTPVIVDSFNQSMYRSAKYMVTTTAASSAEFAEFAMVHMGATAAVSNVNRVITGSTLTMFIANISGTTVRLWANTVTGTANIKLQKTYFVV